jgi:hypothetical protein
MDTFGKIVREGHWRYAGSVEVAVRVRESEVRYGSGDHDDPPEVREDVPVRCFYVDWDGAGTGRSSSVTGPFDTQLEAEEFAVQQAGGTIRWLS